MGEKPVLFVTGGARGIGKAVALKFAENGYDIVSNYVTESEELVATKKEFEAKGAEVLLVKADVTKKEEIENLVKVAMDKFGRIDVLVNNAGITNDMLMLKMKEEDFDKVIDVNLKGTFIVTKAVISIMMKQRRGSIVNLSSVVGVAGNAGQCNYSASKAGILGFTKSLAKELAARNIRVNAVAPGFIDTRMTECLSDKVKDTIFLQIPLKRMGTAREVANTVYFLGTDESSYITGQTINIDGGMVM